MKGKPLIRLAIGSIAIGVMQASLHAADVGTCSICSGPNTPQSGRAAGACNGTTQTGIFDEENPAGALYSPPLMGFECLRPTPGGSHRCNDLLSGCCLSPDTGRFMCNIVIQPDCSFKSVCASICCPSGRAKVVEQAVVGCTNKCRILGCDTPPAI